MVVVPVLAISGRFQCNYRRENPREPLNWVLSRITLTGLGLVPGLIAGLSLAARWGGGLYWLLPTTLPGIASAVSSAWILLVEILR